MIMLEDDKIVIASDDTIGTRLTVTEAMTVDGTSFKENDYLFALGSEDEDFKYDNHFFGLVLNEWHGLSDSEVMDIVRERQKDNVIIRHKDWCGLIYHHSRNPAKVLKEGWKFQGDLRDPYEFGSLSFGPGLYCYYRQGNLMKPDDDNLLIGLHRGDFYTCLYYNDGSEHETYGYIPYDYQNIRWYKFHSMTSRTLNELRNWEYDPLFTNVDKEFLYSKLQTLLDNGSRV